MKREWKITAWSIGLGTAGFILDVPLAQELVRLKVADPIILLPLMGLTGLGGIIGNDIAMDWDRVWSKRPRGPQNGLVC